MRGGQRDVRRARGGARRAVPARAFRGRPRRGRRAVLAHRVRVRRAGRCLRGAGRLWCGEQGATKTEKFEETGTTQLQTLSS